MYHTPNIELVNLQAKAANIPLVSITTIGEKEKELKDLEKAIILAKKKYKIKGVISGAVASTYQASRIQRICNKLNLWCINPLWQKDQIELLNELMKNKFKIIICGVFAEPFTENHLGRKLDKKLIKELIIFSKKYKINPSGEGGEIETFVLNCPLFRKKIKILETKKSYSNYSGIYQIIKARLEDK